MQYLNSHKYSNCFLHFICKFFGFHLQSDNAEQKVIDEIIGNTDKFESSDEKYIYLQGIQDAIESMSHHRINKLKG